MQREKFKHVKPHEHLWYFTATQLRDLLEANGFTVLGMDVPIPGKVTAYASPSVIVEEIEVHGPPGVGDILWTLQKLKNIREKEWPCRLKYVVCCDGDTKAVTRAKDFLLSCEYVDAVDFRYEPLPRDVGCEHPSKPIYELFPNDYLEPKVPPFVGQFIEKWRPELADDWGPAFQISRAASEQVYRRTDGKDYVAIYMSSHVWNWTVSEPAWTPKHWAELLIKLSDAGFRPVILGAGNDSEYARTVAENIVQAGRVPSKIWINLIDRTSLPLAMAYMHEARLTIGVANGLPMLPLYTGNKALIFWPTRGLSRTKAEFTKEFRTNWLPPHIRESGNYKDLIVGQFTVDDIFNESMSLIAK
jgi:hypothetical protein